MAERYTKRQGEYLAFIHLYTKLNRRPPAETDFQDYFRVSSAAVHQMIVSLENRELIQRTPGQARSIQLLISPDALPDTESRSHTAQDSTTFSERYPNIAFWVQEQGSIELGYDYNTDTCARAIDEGGMCWGGGERHATCDEWLSALEMGIGDFAREQGLL